MVCDAVAEQELLIEFITADLGQVISSRIEEHAMDQALSRIHCQRFARTDLLIQFKKAFLIVRRRIFRERSHEFRLIAEQLNDFLVCSDTQRSDQLCDRDFSGTVDTDIENVVRIRLVLEPCAAIRNNGAGEQSLTDLVMRDSVINAGGTHELTDDNTLGAVDNERAGCRHKRKIAHENLMFLDFAVFLVQQTDRHVQRGRIIRVTFLALLDRVLDLISAKFIIYEFEAQLIAEVFDRRDVIEYLSESLVDEPFIRRLLDLDQVGHLQNFFPSLVAHSNRSAGLNWTNSVFLHSTFHPVIS